MTSTVIVYLIASAWIASAALASVFVFSFISVNLTCSSPYSAAQFFYPQDCVYLANSLILLFTYSHIFTIAKQQHQRIQMQNMNIPVFIAGGSSVNLEIAKNQAINTKKSEFKAARMIGVVVMAFVGFWFPALLGRALNAAGITSVTANYLAEIGVDLGLMNSSFNWIIYASANTDFKLAFKRILKIRLDIVDDTNSSRP